MFNIKLTLRDLFRFTNENIKIRNCKDYEICGCKSGPHVLRWSLRLADGRRQGSSSLPSLCGSQTSSTSSFVLHKPVPGPPGQVGSSRRSFVSRVRVPYGVIRRWHQGTRSYIEKNQKIIKIDVIRTYEENWGPIWKEKRDSNTLINLY